MTRLALADFETNNPLYAGAAVSILAVTADESEERFLEIFGDSNGVSVLPNPQTLNAQGRWPQSVYVEADYRLSIEGAEFENHETGVRRLGVLAIRSGDGIGVRNEKGVVTVRVTNPFTADEKQKLASAAAFNLWRDVVRDLGDQIANDDRFMIGDADGPEHQNGFITGLQLKTFIGTVAGSFHLWTSVTSAIGTDIADDDRVLIGDKSATGQRNKYATIASLKAVFGSRFAASRVRANYQVVDADYGKVLMVDTASARRTIELPPRAARDAGFRFWVYKMASSNSITIDPNAEDSIDGASTFSMTRRGEAVLVVWDGTAWQVVVHETPGLSGFDLYEEITTALAGNLNDNDRIAVAAVRVGGEPNRFATAKKFKDYINAVDFPALADGVRIAWDVGARPVAHVTLGGNRTLANPANAEDGATYALVVTQDATGSRSLSFENGYEFGNLGSPTLSTGGGDRDVLVFMYFNSKMNLISIVKGY